MSEENREKRVGKEEKVLKIIHGSLDRFEAETFQDLKKIKEKEKKEGSDSIFFEDPSMLRKVLTEKRQELIEEVMENPPESIRSLARALERGPREVYEDVYLLEKYKILKLEKEGNRKKPRIPYDRIHIEIDLPFKLGSESERATALP